MLFYFLIFAAFLFAIVLCTHGVVRAALKVGRGIDIPTVTLSLVLGIPLFLLSFSLVARVIAPYQFALPLTLLLLFGAGCCANRGSNKPVWCLGWSDRVCLSFFGMLALSSYLLRTYWPAIHWENSVVRIGVERMFNLSLQQSFLHARGWPVENLWLYGEPLDYHVLLRALPGLTSWIVRAVTGDAMSGGVIYLLTDALYLSLAPTALLACALITVPLVYPQVARVKVALLSGLFALLAFLTPNGTALAKSLRFFFFGTGSDDFWRLQHAVVPGTVSYFPFGLLLSGESHSYAQAPFLSVCWLGLTIVYVAGTKNFTLTTILAALGAMITQSHPATAMVCALVSLPLFTWDAVWPFWRREERPWRNGAHSLLLGFLAGILLIPMYLEHLPPEMKWVFVSTSVVSSVWPFIKVHLFATLCLLMAAVALVASAHSSQGERLRARGLVWLSSIMLCAISLYQRPIIALSIVYAGLVVLLLGAKRPVPVLVLLGAFLVWIFPEVAVTDWVYDNRTDWIRFNTAMRLWLESTYLFPLAALLLVTPEFAAMLEKPRVRLVVASGVFSLLGCVLISLYAFTTARMDRAPERPSVDGYTFLRDERPRDFELINYLNQLPGTVVIGEACGDGSHPLLPYHYGSPGRIAAFSGRPSLCGWARHTWMFQRRLRRANVANETIWQSFLSTGESLKILYTTTSATESENEAALRALRYLRQRGVTHLVVGELERAVFPTAEPQSIARAIGGRVIFNPAPGIGVVELPGV
jgi:uncharacterized membrane protein